MRIFDQQHRVDVRCFPIFGVFWNGMYKLQPIFVDDFAVLAVEKEGEMDNEIIEAIGPETFEHREIIENDVGNHSRQTASGFSRPATAKCAICVKCSGLFLKLNHANNSSRFYVIPAYSKIHSFNH